MSEIIEYNINIHVKNPTVGLFIYIPEVLSIGIKRELRCRWDKPSDRLCRHRTLINVSHPTGYVVTYDNAIATNA